MKSVFYAYMIAVLVLSACSSGKTTFERGNYYEAVITSVNRLRRNSDHKKSVETLRQAYPMAVAFYQDRANTALATAGQFKWTEVVNSYTAISTMYDEIKRCPGALAVVPNPINYFSKLQEARQNAAEEHYAAGIVALQFGTRDKAKQAYGFFKTTNGYVPGYKEVNDYMQTALWAATVKILVEPIPVQSKTVGVSAEFFNDKISEYVHSANINEFVRFFTRTEAQKIKLNPDHIIQLQFDDFTVGQIYRHEKEIQLTKDSVVMGTYITTSAGAQQNGNTKTNPTGGSQLVTTGNPVVATTQTPPVNTNPNSNTGNTDAGKAAKEQAERERLERERVARALAERQRLEKELAEKALAEKLRIEREAAERDRLARQAAEQAQAERTLAEKQRLERERLEKEQAEKALAEKAKVESEAAEKERLAKQAAEKDQAERELAEKQRLERERLEKEQADQALADKEKAEREAAEKERLAKQTAERELAEKQRLEKEKLAKEQAEKALAEKVKADKEAADRALAEKVKADKEKAEKDKAEKEKAEKDSYVDDSIHKDDTTDVKDPVTICHIPPGNKMYQRTLVISRSALKAHLGHGDMEGNCESEKKDQKGKPQDDKKGKGPGAKIDADKNEQALLFRSDQVLFASIEKDPDQFLRYTELTQVIEPDTNKVYGTVKATLHHYSKTTTSKGIVSFKIIDAKTGALLSVEKMPGEFVWVSEWATFNGDERALSAEQLRLTKLKELAPPPPQDLFIEFTKPIYDQITTKIREFYKGY